MKKSIVMIAVLLLTIGHAKDNPQIPGGSVLANCTYQSFNAASGGCPITMESRYTEGMFFGTMDQCKKIEKMMRSHNEGLDPRCVPCEYIYMHKEFGMSCKWK